LPMIELVEGYRGDDEGLNRRVAEIIDRSWGMDPDHAPAIEPTRLEDVREWFSDEETESCLLLYSGEVVGFAMLYESRDYTQLWIEVDPEMRWLATEGVAREVAGWCSRARARRGLRKPVRVGAGLEHGWRREFLRRFLRQFIAFERLGGTFMRLSEAPKIVDPPSGFRIREGSVEDYRIVADIYNDAFSIHPWFHEWSYDDARRYLERRRPILVVAETVSGEPAGYVTARIFRALDGEVSAYIATLAVARRFQRRGLGRALMTRIVHKVLEQGVEQSRVFLDSVEGLETYYASMGFRGVRRYASIYLSIP